MINNKKYNENLKTECIDNDRYNPSPSPNSSPNPSLTSIIINLSIDYEKKIKKCPINIKSNNN